MQYLADWKAAGGQLFAVFSSVGKYGKWGSWGILEHEFQDPKTAPKFRAVTQFLEENPRWWPDQPDESGETEF